MHKRTSPVPVKGFRKSLFFTAFVVTQLCYICRGQYGKHKEKKQPTKMLHTSQCQMVVFSSRAK